MKTLSDIQKLNAVMDIIKKDMSYDYTFRAGTQSCHLQNIDEGIGVCVDISLLTLYLCDEIGLKEPGVAGVNIDLGHYFNFVDIDGVRTYFDPTGVITANARYTSTDPIEFIKSGFGKYGWGTTYTIQIWDGTSGAIYGAKN